MKKDPGARYASYADLIAALEAAAPSRVEPAGFWTRAVATVMDSLLASGLIGLLGWIGLVLHIVYVTVAQAYFGQTAAKYVLRIRVERTDGTRLGPARSLVRLVASMWLPFLGGTLALSHGFVEFKDKVTQLAVLTAAQALLKPLITANVYLALVYGAGLAVAALDPQKRAVHDLLVGSRVVYRLGSNKLAVLPRSKAK